MPHSNDRVHRAPLAVAFLCGVVACSSTIKPPKRTRLTTKEIVEVSKPAIVRVEVTSGEPGGAGVGTGFLVGADGRVATNLHVIRGANEIRVTLLDGTKLSVTEVLAVDEQRDLAVIAVQSPQKFPTLTLGDSSAVSAGDHIIAIGNPLGVLDYTVSDGLISSVRPLNPELTILQISAPISHGSSGGPLFNHYGEVIGVATAIVTEGQNLNFGIPANYLRPLMEKARGEGLSPVEFTKQFESSHAPPAGGEAPTAQIQRQIPNHAISALDGCTEASLVDAVRSIDNAIRVGAPLYNGGNHEACFRVYEGTAMRLEQELGCTGLRDALGQGLLRASTLESFTEKAWALRDAFDGIIDVVLRKARTTP